MPELSCWLSQPGSSVVSCPYLGPCVMWNWAVRFLRLEANTHICDWDSAKHGGSCSDGRILCLRDQRLWRPLLQDAFVSAAFSGQPCPARSMCFAFRLQQTAAMLH